jgi:hypothetical protein
MPPPGSRSPQPLSTRNHHRNPMPLRTGATPAALTPSALKIGEVTSWLLRRADDLTPRQQQLLADARGHGSQLDRLAEHVTGFAKMMTKRTGNGGARREANGCATSSRTGGQ